MAHEAPGIEDGPGPTPPLPEGPRQPSRGERIGRRLRVLAGVDETVLAWMPAEKARYTGLGGVVLGTATIATVSMSFALSEVVGGFNLLLPVIALIWGAFILNLDRWLVSSALGPKFGRRLSMVLPRVVLAFFFGVVIAEPIVLRAFEPAIEQHINDQRQQASADLRQMLIDCNPDPTTADAATVARAQQRSECAGHRAIPVTQIGLATQLSGYQAQARALTDTIGRQTTEIADARTRAANECAGTKAAGTSGQRGRGPECLRDEAQATELERRYPVATEQADLNTLNQQIHETQAALSGGQGDFQEKLKTYIDQQVDELKAHQGAIGLLERFRALDELTATNVFLLSATWFVRLFFITVDCLPVVVKFFGGRTRYDELLENRGRSSARIHVENTITLEQEIVEDLKSQQAETRDAHTMRRENSDLDLRWRRAQLRMQMEERITELSGQMGGARTSTVPRPRHAPFSVKQPEGGARGRNGVGPTAEQPLGEK